MSDEDVEDALAMMNITHERLPKIRTGNAHVSAFRRKLAAGIRGEKNKEGTCMYKSNVEDIKEEIATDNGISELMFEESKKNTYESREGHRTQKQIEPSYHQTWTVLSLVDTILLSFFSREF